MNEDVPSVPDEDVGTPLLLTHATSAGRLVLSHGNIFAVTDAWGNITPAGARELGVFSEDTRHLSHWELRLPRAPTLLSTGTEGCLSAQVDLTTTDEEHDGLLDEPIQFLHLQRRLLLDDGFVEQVAFTNHLDRPVAFEVRLFFDADWADVFEVRGARRARRGVTQPAQIGDGLTELRYLGRDGLLYRTQVHVHPSPASMSANEALLRVALAPGARCSYLFEVRFGRGPTPLPPPEHRGWDPRVSRAKCAAEAFRAGCVDVRCDDAVLHRAFQRALSDVHALRVDHAGQSVIGAGIPWFAAPFGRDALITSAQLLPFAPGLAGESLRFLAAMQGRAEVAEREEEPGRILHELRRGEMVRAGEIPHAPYFGSIDVTPLFVVLVEELWRWTADVASLDALWPAVRSAMAWLDRATDEGRSLLRYQRRTPLGLENQGWKDSRDGVSFADGRRAKAPIALVEVQGYAIAAWRAGADLAHVRGEHALAEAWTSRVAPFSASLEHAFWMPRAGAYALARDGEDRLVTTLTSNPGHLLWSRAVSRDRAERVKQTLLSPELFSGWGIRTVARGQPVYNPLSYHNGSVWPHDGALCALGLARYGWTRDAVRVADGLFAAAEHFAHQRLPELFCGLERGEGERLVHYPVSCSPQAWASGAPFMLLQACLGLEADAPGGVLHVRDPVLPGRIRRLDLLDVRVGDARVSLRFTRSGLRTWAEVLERSGGPLRVAIEVGGG